MQTKILLTAIFLGATSIILGAFGAHALKETLTQEHLTAFETGVKYQMYHALFLLFVGTSTIITNRARKIVFLLTVTGIAFFSGSIYFLTTKNLTGIDLKPIGFITPIGGMLLIIAWIWLFVDLIRKKA